jgi:hypothetical protein
VALTNGTADAVVEGILSDLGLNEAQAEMARSRWRVIVRRIYAGIKADAVVQPTALEAPPGGGAVTGTGTLD